MYSSLTNPNEFLSLHQYKQSFEHSKARLFDYQREIEKRGKNHFDSDRYSAYCRNIMQKKLHMIHHLHCDVNDPRMFPLWLYDGIVHHLWMVSLLIKSDFRRLFGYEKYLRIGYFLDGYLTKTVHEYSYYIDYPSGNQEIALADQIPAYFWNMRGQPSRVVMDAMVCSSDGRYLFAAAAYDIVVMDLVSFSVITQLRGHFGIVRCLDYKLGRLATGTANGSVIIWDAYQLTCVLHLNEHIWIVNSVKFNQSGDQVISASADGSVRCWSVDSGVCLMCLDGHCSLKMTADYLSDDKVIIGSRNLRIQLWNCLNKEGESLQSSNFKFRSPIADMSINCDRSLMACVIDGYVVIFSLPRMDYLFSVDAECLICRFHPTLPQCLALSHSFYPLIKLFSIIRDDFSKNRIQLMDVSNDHTQRMSGIDFTPEGSRLISTSFDFTMRVWDLSQIL